MPRGQTAAKRGGKSATGAGGSRKGANRVAHFDSDSDEDIVAGSMPASQDSDDRTMLELALTERWIAEKEKKMKDKMKVHLRDAKEGISGEFSLLSDRLSIATDACKEKYSSFTVQYAVDSDRIRALWSALEEEMKVFGELCTKMEGSTGDEGDVFLVANRLSIEGMAQMKTAYTQMDELKASLQSHSSNR